MEKESNVAHLLEGLVGVLLAFGKANPKAPSEPKIENPGPPAISASPENTAPKKSPAPSDTSKARVAPFWQEFTIKQFKAGNFDEGWGIFSYGGWSDAGQVIVLSSKTPGISPKLIIGKANSQEVEFERNLGPGEFGPLKQRLKKISTFSDVDLNMFDGLVYEFVVFKKATPKNPSEEDWVEHRAYYKNPGIHQKFPAIDSLIELAQTLRNPKK
jgi:hypothetical protein